MGQNLVLTKTTIIIHYVYECNSQFVYTCKQIKASLAKMELLKAES